MIELPTTKSNPVKKGPNRLIVFSKPKMGKTTALAALPNNLIVDLEKGSTFVSALAVQINSIAEINELCAALKKADYPYDYITLDTVTMLEELCKPLALKLYIDTPAGSKFTGKDILTAPNGSGYGFLRTAVEMVIDKIASCTKNIIMVCHSKDAAISETELNVKQIDLYGKTGRILSSRADAIGFLYRDDESNTILSFNTADKFVECGARPEHLRNKDVVLGEMVDGNLEFHWERIFPELN